MKFPKYWTRAVNSTNKVVARGWSEVSQEEADRNAQARLRRILAALKPPRSFDLKLERYDYVIDNVICEEVVDRIEQGGRELGVVSRNAYGSLILNAAELMFVDIDFPKPHRGGCLFVGWFRRRPVEPPPEETALASVRRWQAAHPDISLRVYRTYAGLRLMVINRAFTSVDEAAVEVMQQLGSDTLYVQLCRSQHCFRSRLSPKPWRIGMQKIPAKFPFETSAEQQAFEQWNARYVATAANYRVCRLVEILGDAAPLEQHFGLIDLHDRLCSVQSDLELA
ncbi:MAG: hypothetical protein KDA72_09715 [Planctomycetales bacterium]|nr:hypothetical protein [Planctomycetales bacterium]